MSLQQRCLAVASCVVVLAVIVVAAPAAAQDTACVYNQPGGGYVAKMGVCGGSNCKVSDWSGGFPIGQTECKSLDKFAGGTQVTVAVDAEWGTDTNCSPEFTRDANFNGTAVFGAWGTTLSPKCEQPGGTTSGEACVYLEPGAGYVAQMRVCSTSASSCDDDDHCGEWTSGFAIGKTGCQSLAAIADGAQFTVCVHAEAGHTIGCLPRYQKPANYGLNVVYHAFGTTLQPGCRVPGE